MNSTALGATNKTESGIMFKSNAHEKFYYEKLKEVQYQDEYHMALFYCLGINNDTRQNFDRIYDLKNGLCKARMLKRRLADKRKQKSNQNGIKPFLQWSTQHRRK